MHVTLYLRNHQRKGVYSSLSEDIGGTNAEPCKSSRVFLVSMLLCIIVYRLHLLMHRTLQVVSKRSEVQHRAQTKGVKTEPNPVKCEPGSDQIQDYAYNLVLANSISLDLC